MTNARVAVLSPELPVVPKTAAERRQQAYEDYKDKCAEAHRSPWKLFFNIPDLASKAGKSNENKNNN
eukprot:CAMPEP_0171487526 /NCGR_PEP_ID=MMETSP0958-20121227/1699_1 /TAXON_ID=87120 /ORGANISM="Aurantiochytrium limacinum, Strain ATCCMYA-1381" /LENGTH=66 /DNA_ID=CAMNT_0012020535 /DNA_START=126 /DNA_END=326 /DNA_ORIENTATION=+